MGSVEEAKELLDNLNKKIIEAREVLQKQEEYKAEMIISGKSEAGMQVQKKSHAEEVKERCNELLKSTGMKIQ